MSAWRGDVYAIWRTNTHVDGGFLNTECAGVGVGKTPRVVRKPMQPGDVEKTWADLTRSGAELGYKAGTGVEEGLRRQWEWMRGQK